MNKSEDDMRMRAAMKAVQAYYPNEGIALLVFVPNGTVDGQTGPMVNYIGNVPREEMLTKLKVVVGRWEGTKHAGTTTEH